MKDREGVAHFTRTIIEALESLKLDDSPEALAMQADKLRCAARGTKVSSDEDIALLMYRAVR